MKTFVFGLMLVLCVSGCSHKTENGVADISQAKAAAQKSAEQWLAQVDAGDYSGSWTAAAAYFQTAVPQDQWIHDISTAREPLGSLISRQLIGATYMTSLPGAPAGKYVVLQFDASFSNKKKAVETITPRLEADGQWKVSGYYIK